MEAPAAYSVLNVSILCGMFTRQAVSPGSLEIGTKAPSYLCFQELDFQLNAPKAVEALIHINNQLRQPESAVGVLTYANRHLNMELKESWYEKLCRWDDALLAYERR